MGPLQKQVYTGLFSFVLTQKPQRVCRYVEGNYPDLSASSMKSDRRQLPLDLPNSGLESGNVVPHKTIKSDALLQQ